MFASTDLWRAMQAIARGLSRVASTLVVAALSGQPARPAVAQAEAASELRVGASTAPRLARLRQAIETHRRHAKSQRRNRDIVGPGSEC